MNVAVMLLHIDCPSRDADHAIPPKMQTLGQDGQLYGRCPACNVWVTVDLTPVDVIPITSPLPLPAVTEG